MPIQGAVGARLALKETIARQMQDLTIEMDSLRTVNERLRFQISAYQARIDNIPLRGIELSKITRNYDITLGKYKELLAKRLESELSENMEKKQKGEQFQVIERPTFPEKPIAPDRPRILFIGLALGLAAGVGVAFLLEKLNTAFNKAEDLDGYIDVPLLAALPAVMTRGTLLERRRAQSMLVIGSVGALAIGMAVIRSFGTSFAGY
jgi:hypothetical protein